MKRIHVVAYGRVQGVGFRAFVQQSAHVCGLSGYVKNLPDGTVEIEAEGIDALLELFIQKITDNSGGYIHVDTMTRHDIDPQGDNGFVILR